MEILDYKGVETLDDLRVFSKSSGLDSIVSIDWRDKVKVKEANKAIDLMFKEVAYWARYFSLESGQLILYDKSLHLKVGKLNSLGISTKDGIPF